MTTPSLEFHSELLLLPIVLFVLISPAADQMFLAVAAEQQQPMITRPGCQDKCGSISIPFPFGIDPQRCFREGFEVFCDDSASPSRAFLADPQAVQYVSEASTSSATLLPKMVMPLVNSSKLQLEIINISAATSEARVYGGVSYLCNTDETSGLFKLHLLALQNSPFAMSATRNVLVGVGWRDEPYLAISSGVTAYDEFFCRSDFLQEDFVGHAVNGSCAGQGCCQNTFPPAYRSVDYVAMSFLNDANSFWPLLPCSYAMLVEKSWYNFSTPDMYGDKVLAKRFPWSVPLVLDFAIANAASSCPAGGQQQPKDYACVSGNSYCANVTIGYVCRCSEYYEGNPYITDGCQDIDECKHPQLYNCSSDGICKNRPGGYDCPCKFGMKGDGKEGTCTNIFSLAAKVTVGNTKNIFNGTSMVALPNPRATY